MAIAADSVRIPTFSQELPAIFAQQLTDWMKRSDPVIILVAGEEGSGKSTLINCLLNTTKAPVRKELFMTKPKANELKSYEGVAGNIKVTVWEVPANPPKRKLKECAKNAHLVFFCVNMSETRYIEKENYESMAQLSGCLGVDVFKNAMFVLTFANNYISLIEDDHKDNPEGKKKDFLHIVESWKTKLQSTLEKKIHLDQESAKKTKVVPVGRQLKKCPNLTLFPDDTLDWHSKLWREAITVNSLVTPSVVKIYDHVSKSHNESQSNNIAVSFTLHLGEDLSLKHISNDMDSSTLDIKG